MTPRRVLLALVAVVVLVALGMLVRRVMAERLVATWLAQDCTVGESGQPELRLPWGGGAVKRALKRAYERGMPPQTQRTIANAAGRQYDQTIAALDAGRRYGLSADAERGIRDLTRVGYVTRAVEKADRRYRSAARRGLELVSRRAVARGVAP